MQTSSSHALVRLEAPGGPYTGGQGGGAAAGSIFLRAPTITLGDAALVITHGTGGTGCQGQGDGQRCSSGEPGGGAGGAGGTSYDNYPAAGGAGGPATVDKQGGPGTSERPLKLTGAVAGTGHVESRSGVGLEHDGRRWIYQCSGHVVLEGEAVFLPVSCPEEVERRPLAIYVSRGPGLPVEGAEIELFREGLGALLPDDAPAVTDGDGWYTGPVIPAGLPIGESTVRVTPPDGDAPGPLRATVSFGQQGAQTSAHETLSWPAPPYEGAVDVRPRD